MSGFDGLSDAHGVSRLSGSFAPGIPRDDLLPGPTTPREDNDAPPREYIDLESEDDDGPSPSDLLEHPSGRQGSEEDGPLDPIQQRFKEHSEELRLLREAVSRLRSDLLQSKTPPREAPAERITPNLSGSAGMLLTEPQSPLPLELQQGSLGALRRRFDAEIRALQQELFTVRKELLVLQQAQAKAPKVIEKIVEVRVPVLPTPHQGEPTVVRAEDTDADERHAPKVMTVTPLPLALPVSHHRDSAERDALRIDHREETMIPSPLPSPPSREPKSRTESSRLRQPPPQLPPGLPTPDESVKPMLRPVKQQIEELLVMTPDHEIESRILNLIIDIRTQLQLQVDQNTTRLNALEPAIAAFVDKDFVAKFFSKMRATLNELSGQVSVMRQALPDRVTKTEMQDSLEEMVRSLTQGQETSGGSTSYKCLLCGREKKAIAGMINDSRVATALGDPPEAIAGLSRPSSRGPGTMLYGTDKQLYHGRGNLGRTAIASTLETKRPLPSLDRKA
jgi:hypothetical protein